MEESNWQRRRPANTRQKREPSSIALTSPSITAFDPLLRVTFWTQVGMLWFRLGKYAEATHNVLTTALDLAESQCSRSGVGEIMVWAHGLKQLYGKHSGAI
ncbi:MAG: hypothetical protein U0Q18_01415 [Bryobacteraceae bacterium]